MRKPKKEEQLFLSATIRNGIINGEKFWNSKIFRKTDDVWSLKDSVYKDLIKKESNVEKK